MEEQLTKDEWEKAGYSTAKVAKARENLKALREQKTELRKLWSTYKFYNHEEPWYVELIYKIGADIKDANRYQDELGKTFIEGHLDPQKQGANIYNTLETVKRDIADEMAVISENVMDLWELGVPLKLIAKAYGASENTTYIFITRQPRFKIRRTHPESPTVDTTVQPV